MGCSTRAILVSISYRSTLNVLLYAGGPTSTLMVLLLVTRTLTELGTFGCWVASTETHKKYNNTEMVKQDLQDDILARVSCWTFFVGGGGGGGVLCVVCWCCV